MNRREALIALAGIGGIPRGRQFGAAALPAAEPTLPTINPTRPEAPGESWIEWSKTLASLEYNGIQGEHPGDWEHRHYAGKVWFGPGVRAYFGFGPYGAAQCDLFQALSRLVPGTLLGGALHPTGRTWCILAWERGAV